MSLYVGPALVVVLTLAAIVETLHGEYQRAERDAREDESHRDDGDSIKSSTSLPFGGFVFAALHLWLNHVVAHLGDVVAAGIALVMAVVWFRHRSPDS